ncbi:MFS transporter [Sphingobium sp. 3R8]|uniref:MFS transporter n=1 Tax=Sphingobium sp. 3R8 TaxID=2874921 RepID=UPI001CCAFC4F|nr:MFS transporter [Sphingobium sp. 3R8]MBZ9648372.1 MFS transporter [Sphingobium sp. 3R8]
MDVLAQTDVRYRRDQTRMLAACSALLCINAAFPIYGASVVNTAMVSAMGLDRSLLGLLVSANMAITGLTAPIMGALVGRVGARRVLILGSVMLILGSIAMATIVQGALPAILAFGLLVGLAMSAGGFVANQACVAGWFKEDRARPFAVLYATMGAGGFIAAPLISGAIGLGNDWRAGWLVFVALGVIALGLALFVVRDAPHMDDSVDLSMPMQATGTTDTGLVPVCIVIFCIMAAGASSSVYIAHGLAMLSDFGRSFSAAATSMSIMAASTLAGNFAIGALGGRFGIRRILAAGSVTFAFGLMLLMGARSTSLFYIYPLFLGAGFGAVQVGAMALLSKCVAPSRFAATTGIAISLQTVASAITPFLGGWLFDKTHTYLPLVGTLVGLNVIAALLLLVSGRAFPTRA